MMFFQLSNFLEGPGPGLDPAWAEPGQPSGRVAACAGESRLEARELFGVDPRDEDFLSGLVQRTRCFDDLVGGLLAAVHDLRDPLAKGSMGIDPRL